MCILYVLYMICPKKKREINFFDIYQPPVLEYLSFELSGKVSPSNVNIMYKFINLIQGRNEERGKVGYHNPNC